MIQKIIDGTIGAIRTKYDKTFKIYTESVEQGLKTPSFSVLCLNGTNTERVGTRNDRSYLLNIKYFPSTDEPIAECLAVMEDLYTLLGIISVGNGNLRGTNMSGEVIDGVLQFQVTYAPTLLMVGAEENMEELEVSTDGKE